MHGWHLHWGALPKQGGHLLSSYRLGTWWQRTYLYEERLRTCPLEPGDRLRIECTYNNSVSEPILMRWSPHLARHRGGRERSR